MRRPVWTTVADYTVDNRAGRPLIREEVKRLPVPGGWLYRVVVRDCDESFDHTRRPDLFSTVFVPDPERG